MTNEGKLIVAEYMNDEGALYNCAFDCNYAGLCVQEMQKRGDDWRKFHNFSRNLYYTTERSNLKIDYNFVAWLLNADNFFTVMTAWIKEEKK